MTSRTRVKICGMTRAEDALEAARLGVDALGFVFYAKSPRNVDIEQAQAIIRLLPGFVTTVALFLNPQESLVKQVVAETDIDCLQFHGTESAAFCESANKPYIKALGIDGVENMSALCEEYTSAQNILLDSHGAGKVGGTGATFDWNTIPETLRSHIILAGGISPDNVADAIQQVRPYAVDLSSSVESVPGIKDKILMTRLMNEVKRVDCAQ